MSKTAITLLSTIFLLLPTTQSISLANNLNEKTYDFSINNSVSGSFTGTDTNKNGLLENSEISNFSLSVNNNPNHQCQTKDLNKFIYESPTLKLNRQAKELENELFKYIEEAEGIFIRTKEEEIRYALIKTIAYVFEEKSDFAYLYPENQRKFFQERLIEKEVSTSLIKNKTIDIVLSKIGLKRSNYHLKYSMQSQMAGANIYIHCLSDDSKFKTEFILNNFKEEGVFGVGSYSLKLNAKQGFLNSSSRKISGMISPGSISIREQQLDSPSSNDRDRESEQISSEEKSTTVPISNSTKDLL